MPAVHLTVPPRAAGCHGRGVVSEVVKTSGSKRDARALGVTAATAGTCVLAACALAIPATAQAASAGPAGAAPGRLAVTQIAHGDQLHHKFQPNGKGAWHTEPLTKPDDIARLGQRIFVTFQNGVGPQGEASADGNLDSTIAEFTLSGREVAQWDLRGKCDGLSAGGRGGVLIATVNEDLNSSLYTIKPGTGTVTHYSYNKPLPHNGGTDAISVDRGQILISASAPGTTGAASPNAKYPAVYAVTLDDQAKVASVSPLYYDEAPAGQANGAKAGKVADLALTDPDSSEVVPWSAPRYAGDFMLDSQGDQELIFDDFGSGKLTALHLPTSVDDSAWATSEDGALYVTDSTANTVDTVTGSFTTGTMYSSVTPCGSNSAPATCPAPGFPANYLATVNMSTGALTPVPLTGPVLRTGAMIFVPGHRD